MFRLPVVAYGFDSSLCEIAVFGCLKFIQHLVRKVSGVCRISVLLGQLSDILYTLLPISVRVRARGQQLSSSVRSWGKHTRELGNVYSVPCLETFTLNYNSSPSANLKPQQLDGLETFFVSVTSSLVRFSVTSWPGGQPCCLEFNFCDYRLQFLALCFSRVVGFV